VVGLREFATRKLNMELQNYDGRKTHRKSKRVLGQLTGMMERNAALFSGKYTDYRTPKPLFAELNKEFCFTLDPCRV